MAQAHDLVRDRGVAALAVSRGQFGERATSRSRRVGCDLGNARHVVTPAAAEALHQDEVIRAGTPTAVARAGTSCSTTAFAPISA